MKIFQDFLKFSPEVSFLFVNCLSVSPVEYITAGQPPTEPLSKAGGGTSSQSVTVRDI